MTQESTVDIFMAAAATAVLKDLVFDKTKSSSAPLPHFTLILRSVKLPDFIFSILQIKKNLKTLVRDHFIQIDRERKPETDELNQYSYIQLRVFYSHNGSDQTKLIFLNQLIVLLMIGFAFRSCF